MAKQQLQKWELKCVTELEPLEGASPVPESSLSCVLALQELVIVVAAGGVRQNSGYLG